MDINLNLYKYFYEVAKCGSYTKASEKLLVSQPSISYSIKTLEEQLGLKLFNRKNGKIVLTNEGKIIYKKISDGFKIFDSIKKDLNKEELSGKIVIGSRAAYANNILENAVFKFNKLYPDIRVDILIRTRDEMDELLLNNTVDLVIDEFKYCENNNDSCIKELEIKTKSIIEAATKFKDEIE